MADTKKIKITSNGYLNAKGGIKGPILAPYRENIGTIKLLLAIDKATVIEILNDGSEFPLNLNNYYRDNNTPEPVLLPEDEDEKPNIVTTPPQPEEKKEEAKETVVLGGEEKSEDVAPEEEKKEEAKEEEKASTPYQSNYKKNKNKTYNNSNKADVAFNK